MVPSPKENRSMAHAHDDREDVTVGLLGFVGELVRALQVGAMHGDSMLRGVARGEARDGLFDGPHHRAVRG